MEGPLVLATLLHHADLELVEGAEVIPEAYATLRPKGIKMRVKLRSRTQVSQNAARPLIEG